MVLKLRALLALVALPTLAAFILPLGPGQSHRVMSSTTARSAAIKVSDLKGKDASPVWNEVPDEVYFASNVASQLGGEYPPENLDKGVWDKIRPATFDKLADLADSIDPRTITKAQYVILLEATVRREVKKNPSFKRPASAPVNLDAQQQWVWDYILSADQGAIQKLQKEVNLSKLSQEDFWAYVKKTAAELKAKGINFPVPTLDLTDDDYLDVERTEFVASVQQFLKWEAEHYPVFIITHPKSEEGQKLISLFQDQLGVPVRYYEVLGFEHMKFKVKGKYEWGEARLEAVERLAGTKELPLVWVNGKLIGGPDKVNSNLGSIKAATEAIKAEINSLESKKGREYSFDMSFVR